MVVATTEEAEGEESSRLKSGFDDSFLSILLLREKTVPFITLSV